MPVDPRRLETFRVVATSGSVTAAARLLHLSQPAVTAQLRQLEREVGVPLLVRSARGVAANAAGARLLGYARKVHLLLDKAQDALADAQQGSGELVLAASTTVASYVIPELLASFLRESPRGVRLEVGNSAQVLGWVKEGRAPLGIVEGLERAGGLRLEHFLDDELVPVVTAGAPPSLRSGMELSQLPLIWREPGSGTRAVVERALRRAGIRRPVAEHDLTLGSTEAIKGAVRLGMGLAFLSRWSIRTELALGKLQVLSWPLHIPRSFSWVLSSDDPGGVAGRFLRFARQNPPTLRLARPPTPAKK